MKKIVALALALSMVFALCACGSNSAVKEKLCKGVWAYQISISPLLYTDIYDFSEDGTFTYSEYIGLVGSNSSGLHRALNGTYRIDSNKRQILLTYKADEDGDVKSAETIPYYINEYNQSLIFSPDNDGNSKYNNYPEQFIRP